MKSAAWIRKPTINQLLIPTRRACRLCLVDKPDVLGLYSREYKRNLLCRTAADLDARLKHHNQSDCFEALLAQLLLNIRRPEIHIESFSLWVNNRNLRKGFFPQREWLLIAGSIVLCGVTLSCNRLSSRTGAGTSASNLSANRLYREFRDNPIDATNKYRGKTVAVEGLVGKIIPSDHGDATVHIPDHSDAAVNPNDANRAIIATFPRQDDLRGIRTGEKIQLQCAFDKYEFNSVSMSFCTLAKPENVGPEPAIVASNVPSANLLYREYIANEKAASAKYDGTNVEIEARLGNQIKTDDGGAAIHIANDGNQKALIASFPDASAVAGIEQGELFRLRCRVRKFEYQILWLEACEIER